MNLTRGLELVRERTRRGAEESPREHAGEAVAWLRAAQDATQDRGVSHSYLIGERWMRSYPETTGYIIPTLLNWGRFDQDPELCQRALAMADWELGLQREDGAIPDLVSNAPVIFDTGQVMFGWVAAFEETRDARYLDAARRGAEWIADQANPEGVLTHGTDSGGPGRVYNARAVWAVLEYARHDDDPRWADLARRFLGWTLTMETEPGWFDRNCLNDDVAPLLHTIAYTARGHLECGQILGDEDLVAASRRTADALLAKLGPDGYLPGRFRSDWTGACKWSCLTGMAQTSIVWQKLARRDDSPRREEYVDAARRVNRFLMRTQDRSATNPGLRGGIRGSFPVNGAYGRWRVLNWATKFAIDAWLLELDPAAMVYRG